MRPGEEDEVCGLVGRVFKAFVAPHFSQEGVDEFLRYVEPTAMTARAGANHFVLVAELTGKIVGAIEVRNWQHISLLFVDGPLQRQGVARELFCRALETCMGHTQGLRQITVNSSPNAVGAYERLGFQSLGPEQTVNGIRFVPMSIAINEDGSVGRARK